LELRLVAGFANRLRNLGDGRGVEDRTFRLRRILDRNIGLDIR
jgi:hypothetical protein